LVRAAGDNLVMCPAFTVDKSQIDQIVGTLADSIRRHA